MLASNPCQANAQNPKTLQLFAMLYQRSDEITSSFFLKKNYLIWES
jgi:hypothetical protein